MGKSLALLIGLITGKVSVQRDDPAEDWSKDCGHN
jgi:hypothetical protein